VLAAAAAASGDVWKARSAAAAASSAMYAPLTVPPWPGSGAPPPPLPADLLAVAGRPPPSRIEHQLLGRHQQRALDDVKPAPCEQALEQRGRSPLSTDPRRRSFSVFRLVDDCPVSSRHNHHHHHHHHHHRSDL